MSSLRLSVTDRCDLRCRYCLPEKAYQPDPRGDILSFGEIIRIAGILVGAGIRRIRITGGEPLLRRDLPVLVRRLSGIRGIQELSLTTNGIRLSGMAHELKSAGLSRITISLDTLNSEVYRHLTRGGGTFGCSGGNRDIQGGGFSSVKN